MLKAKAKTKQLLLIRVPRIVELEVKQKLKTKSLVFLTIGRLDEHTVEDYRAQAIYSPITLKN